MVELVAAPRQHDDDARKRRPQFAADGETVLAGQVDVKDHDIRHFFAYPLQRVRTIGFRPRQVALFIEIGE